MFIVTKIRQLEVEDDIHIEQILWKLPKTMKTHDDVEFEYLITSFSGIPPLIQAQGIGETYVFPANEHGEVMSWSELAGSKRTYVPEHLEVLAGYLYANGIIGWEIQDENKKVLLKCTNV